MSKQLWKFGGSIGILLLLVAGCSDRQSPQTVSTPANANANPVPLAAPKNVWMTQFEQLNGTPYFHAPIYVAEQENKSILKQIKSASSSYEDRSGWDGIDIRNYMFVHRDNLSGNKLLADNSSRILTLEQIGEPLPPSKSNSDPMSQPHKLKTVKALWYVRTVADTNGDKQLSESDRKQIGISDVSGANYTKIIEDIDKILLNSRIGLDRRLVIYTSGSKRFVANIDLLKRTATTKELPKLS
ncbi:hypothetical protein [Chamaesiphon sp. VAR_69_metabat_338]|uniref:hypothetical protein n=1 Tax=Chamaesiphon sp. VAR_69_metabat_338 TaxID=2964704 RepID=UPI00286E7915|nr:hypothetical protein [Chamaesiphon sp. VAR_69_metabat_338]